MRGDRTGRARLAGTAGIALLLAGCSGNHSTPAHDSLVPTRVPTTLTVTARPVSGLGTVLTDAAGHALYMFPPDAGRGVTCQGPCAGTWPPLVIADGNRAAAGPGVNPQDLATTPDPTSGARVVTYAGFPLYRYAGDVTAGTANGQALFLNGGPWYVLSPDGQPVTTDPGGGP